ADVVLLDVGLKPPAALLDMREAGLAHETDGADAAGDGDVDALVFELLAGLAGVGAQNLRNRVRRFEAARIGFLPQRLDLLQLLAALLVDFFVKRQSVHLGCAERSDKARNYKWHAACAAPRWVLARSLGIDELAKPCFRVFEFRWLRGKVLGTKNNVL